MGREIRRVPKGWEHPKYTAEDAKHSNWVGTFKPLHDDDYETVMAEWVKNHELWQKGEHPDQKEGGRALEFKFYAQWHGNAPDPDYYRPKWEQPADCYQLYETVSEGTPLTPVCETPEALVDYLVNHGDDWGRKEGKRWSRAAAEAIIKEQSCCSFAVVDGKFYDGPETLTIPAKA
jgi:hypothetical protein